MTLTISPDLITTLRGAKHVVILTGAGVSAESGIPTFRGRMTGLWERYSPQQLANADAFQHDPELVWGWYEWRRMLVMKAQPNPAHLAIAQMAAQVPRLPLITQNVDDLHERGGSQDVLHLHGRLHRPFCFDCRQPHAFPPGLPDEPEGGRRLAPPRCGHCGGPIRPGVVWFGERLPEDVLNAAVAACDDCDMLISVGTSSLVQPAAGLPLRVARRHRPVVQVNPEPNPLSAHIRYDLLGPAGSVMPALYEAAWSAV
ncbi:SIR2 family NAD-dependent protein deacylase [Cupriavidus sp. D39]|uniref:SIR2 family NAD-dependent protein deacylase n=1 Tax=Cupriavidus sp. D39 TaxID=2997877 RepID=UPI00226FA60D|nr:NAD-dependent deacylase [Cupriavidus sp. D39]MCY0854030.1 NAD-dependent deacylase [Cupriavidus sp. D39]